jgi:plasmid stabilization system protein ParE
MAFEVRVSAAADAEADAIYEWLAQRAPQGAVRWYNGLLDAIESLADFPRRCSLAPEDEHFDEEIRQLLYGKRRNVYRVLFTIRGNTVHVLHIRHASRRFLHEEES